MKAIVLGKELRRKINGWEVRAFDQNGGELTREYYPVSKAKNQINAFQYFVDSYKSKEGKLPEEVRVLGLTTHAETKPVLIEKFRHD